MNGQDDWTAPDNSWGEGWRVVSNPAGSGRSLRADANKRYQHATRTFQNSEIGGALDPHQSVMAYQFDYYADAGLLGWNVQRFAIGGEYNHAPSFQPRSVQGRR